jgi:hypothetical protein
MTKRSSPFRRYMVILMILPALLTTSCFKRVFRGLVYHKQFHYQRSVYPIRRVNLSKVVGVRYERQSSGAYKCFFTGIKSTKPPFVDWQNDNEIVFLTVANEKNNPRIPAGIWIVGSGKPSRIIDTKLKNALQIKFQKKHALFLRALKTLQTHSYSGESKSDRKVSKQYIRQLYDVIAILDDKTVLVRFTRSESVPRSEDNDWKSQWRRLYRYGVFCLDTGSFKLLSEQSVLSYSGQVTAHVADMKIQGDKVMLAYISNATWLVRLSDWKSVMIVKDNYKRAVARLSPNGKKMFYICRSKSTGGLNEDDRSAHIISFPYEMYIINLDRAYKDLDSRKAVDLRQMVPGFHVKAPFRVWYWEKEGKAKYSRGAK